MISVELGLVNELLIMSVVITTVAAACILIRKLFQFEKHERERQAS